MKTKLNRTWQVELSSDLVWKAGFAEGEILECRAVLGQISLSSKGAAVSFSEDEKKSRRRP